MSSGLKKSFSRSHEKTTTKKMSDKITRDDVVMPGEDTRVWSLAVRDGRIEPELVYASDSSGTSQKLPPVQLQDALKYDEKKRDPSAPHSHFFSSTARSGRVKITVKRPRAAVPAALVDDLTSLLTFIQITMAFNIYEIF